MRIQIYDLRGALIYDSGMTAGPTVQWNLQTNRGDPAANGVYLYVVSSRSRDGNLLRSDVQKITVRK